MVLRLGERYSRGMMYFEEVRVGEATEVGRHTPSREEIISFAKAWDPQPFHIDEAAANASLLGGLSASSCHTYSISSLIYSRSDHKLYTTAMMGLEMRFPNPVRPGEELTLTRAFLDARLSRSRPGQGVVKSRSTLLNAQGAEAMVQTSNYLVACRPVRGLLG
ncbi:MAG: MaoC/PaaZ C-terminal domain-containing protein [Myxococcota bacterium]